MVIPTALVVIYSAVDEPIYYPRYLIFTAPRQHGRCFGGLHRHRRPPTLARRLLARVLLFAIAAVPNYLFVQRWPYAKEGWDYSQVADLISSHAASGDCVMVDIPLHGGRGPILCATGHPARAAFRLLMDVERGVYGPRVGSAVGRARRRMADDGQNRQMPGNLDHRQ